MAFCFPSFILLYIFQNRFKVMIKSMYVSLLLVLFTVSLAAKENHFRIENLSLEEGVSHNLIYAIHQDSRGFMWFGTMFSLIKYDGVEYTQYRHDPLDSATLSNDDIVCITEDLDGNIWVGTYGGGINKFDIDKKQFRRFDQKYFGLDETWNGIVWSIDVDNQNNVYAATRGAGLIKINARTFEFENYRADKSSDLSLNNDLLNKLIVDRTGKLWVCGSKGVLNEYNKNKTGFIKHNIVLPNNNQLIINTLFDLSENQFLIGSNNGLVVYDKSTGKTSLPAFTQSENLKNALVNDIVVSGNYIWLATNSGLFVVDTNLNKTYEFNTTTEQATRSNNIVSLEIDDSGLVWIGSYKGGLQKVYLNKDLFTTIKFNTTEQSVTANNVVGFAEVDPNLVWVSTSEKLYKYNPITKEIDKNFSRSFNGKEITSIAVDINNILWVGTNEGLLRLDDKANVIKTYTADRNNTNALVDDGITNLYISDNGSLWVGTKLIAHKYNAGAGTFERYPSQRSGTGIRGFYVLCTYQDKHKNVWISTYNGLNKIDTQTGSVEHFIHDPDDPTTISSNYVFSMMEDTKGNIWLGTGNGINKYNSKKKSFTYYNEQDGLPNDVITGILEDDHGNLWLSTNKGLSRFDPEKKTFVNFDAADGLQSSMFNDHAAIKLTNGQMLFGGIDGFNVIDTDFTINKTSPPQLQFTSIKNFDKEINTHVDLSHLTKVELGYDQNFITINFAALSYENHSQIRYTYKLEGLEDEWVENSTNYSASYTDLSPGNYVFKVRAFNTLGSWQTDTRYLELVVHPPLWQTWWFTSLLMLSVLVSIVYYHRRKILLAVKRQIEIEKIKAVENELVRKKAADDFHDELGHRITKISLFSEILKRNSDKPVKDNLEYVNKISELAKGLSSGVRDFIWTLDPDKDTLYEVAVRLKDFGDQLFDKTGISFKVDGISTEFEKIRLSMDWRRHLTLMFKEAMNNALKYANCSNVSLSFELIDNRLKLVLNDDGIGFKNATPGGRGLVNLEKRAKNLSGKIEISSFTEKGTQIKFEGAPS